MSRCRDYINGVPVEIAERIRKAREECKDFGNLKPTCSGCERYLACLEETQRRDNMRSAD